MLHHFTKTIITQSTYFPSHRIAENAAGKAARSVRHWGAGHGGSGEGGGGGGLPFILHAYENSVAKKARRGGTVKQVGKRTVVFQIHQ